MGLFDDITHTEGDKFLKRIKEIATEYTELFTKGSTKWVKWLRGQSPYVFPKAGRVKDD